MAIASTAAAAHAAAEVVRLTGTPQSSEKCLEKEKSLSINIAQNEATKLAHQCERQVQESAAVKIQTAFRGYLVSLFRLFSLSCQNFNQFFVSLGWFELVQKFHETICTY